MQMITRKNHLATTLNKLRALFPKEYAFFPKTWVLPNELKQFKEEVRKGRATFIVKPSASSQGRGIYLIKRADQLLSTEHCIAQQYLARPLLIDGHKFDLRLYVLVTGCEPLRVFLHEEGLVRLATEQYKRPTKLNISQTCMHLTNYAVNKNNPNFVSNEVVQDYSGHKRSLSSFLLHLQSLGHDVAALWEALCDLVVKTLVVTQPSLAHVYNASQPQDLFNAHCFEILGFDIILNKQLKPFLLEVNHSPSFTADSPLDAEIKTRVVAEALRLMNIGHKQKARCEKMHREIARKRMLGTRTFTDSRTLISRKRKRNAELRDKLERKARVGYIKVFPDREGAYSKFLDASRRIWQGNSGRPLRSFTTASLRPVEPLDEPETRQPLYLSPG